MFKLNSRSAKRLAGMVFALMLAFASTLPPAPQRPKLETSNEEVASCPGLKLGEGSHDYPFLLSCEQLLSVQEGEPFPTLSEAPERPSEAISELPEPSPPPTTQTPMTGEHYETGSYGERCDVPGVYTGCIFHDGIDWGNNLIIGQPVRSASSSGTVAGVFSFDGPFPCLGNYTVIALEGGTHLVYGHLNTVDVVVGQAVDFPTQIGTIGTTGCSNGPHLHFGVYEGWPSDINHQNPSEWLKQ